MDRIDLGEGCSIEPRADGVTLRIPEIVPLGNLVRVSYGIFVVGACLACATTLAGAVVMGGALIVLLLGGMGATPERGPVTRVTRSLEIRLGGEGYRDAQRTVLVDERYRFPAIEGERVEVRRVLPTDVSHFRVYLVLREAIIDVTGTSDRERALAIARHLASGLGKDPESIGHVGDVVDTGLGINLALGLFLVGAFACATGPTVLYLVLALQRPRPLAALAALALGVFTSQLHLALVRHWRRRRDIAMLRWTFGRRG
jgi:hypothetical protein